MNVSVVTEPGFVAATISGRFDAHRVDEFDRVVISEIDAVRPHLGVDLSDVEFMDSSALACLVRALKACMAHGGGVVVAGASDSARIILELTRLDSVFPMTGTMAEARARAVTASAR